MSVLFNNKFLSHSKFLRESIFIYTYFKSGVIKIIHPTSYKPVKNASFSENDFKSVNMKIGKPVLCKSSPLAEGVWHYSFPKHKKSMYISDLCKLSKTAEYKAPNTDLKNLEAQFWKQDFPQTPLYGSNVAFSLVNSDDYHLGQLATMMRYVQKNGTKHKYYNQ